MTDTKQPLEPDYSLAEVASAIGMSTRWIRNKINDPDDPAEHIRYGNKIRFTEAQVAELRKRHTKAAPAVVTSITAGRKRSRS